MIFLDAVNRIMRITGIIRGDVDAITTFSDLQHGASINLAMIAVQDTFTDLMAFYDFPAERASGSITLLNGTRTYSLPSNFIEFWTDNQWIYDSVDGNHIFEYPGGEKALSSSIFDYQTVTGSPSYWYYIEGSTKQLGFYQVPDITYNNRVLTFDYEKDIVPVIATDTMPFIRDIEGNTFCEMAAIRFNALFAATPKEPPIHVEATPQYQMSRSTLLKLINPNKPDRYYGKNYC